MNCYEKYEEYGLVDVASIDDTVQVELKYGTSDNFMHHVMYDDYKRAFLEKELAQAICNVQRDLKAIDSSLSIIIYDAARPISIQREMFEYVKGTPMERYVANPDTEFEGGFHNYGLAADISIVDKNGKMLDMGTGYDSFSELSHPGNEAQLVAENKISHEAYKNRMLLYYLTAKNGLLPYQYEWWHYQLCQGEESKKHYKLLNF